MRGWVLAMLMLGGFTSAPSPRPPVHISMTSVCEGDLPQAWSAQAPERLSATQFDSMLDSMTWVQTHREEFARVRNYDGPRTRGPAACRAATNADRAAEELRSSARQGLLIDVDGVLGDGRIFYCLSDAEKQRMTDRAAQIDINRRTLERQCAGSD